MRLIDADKIIFHEIDEIGGEYEPYLGCSKDQICTLPTVEAIPVTEKAFEMFETDYKNRLKADMVAMLVDLAKKIEGQCKIPNNCASAYDWNNGVYACYRVIQQEINKLKGEIELQESESDA